MRPADQIKNALTAREVAERYGFEPNRAGFISCPFHSGDHAPSLKLYPDAGGWHCFGCHAGGSVIDFVMRLFDVDFKQAILRLNYDFDLRIAFEKPSKAEESEILKVRRIEKENKEKREKELKRLCELHRIYHEILLFYPPKMNEDGATWFHPFWAEAAKNISRIDYEIGVMSM